jgi:hypothetical protein
MKPAASGDIRQQAYSFIQPLEGSAWPTHLTFVPTRDELYVPIVLRKPDGEGPFPVITMGRGDGHGGMPHVLGQVQRLRAMQDVLIQRGYVVVYVNYRHEIPRAYGHGPAVDIADDISGGENLVRKSAATLDSDDLAAIWQYLQGLPFVRPEEIGALAQAIRGEVMATSLDEGPSRHIQVAEMALERAKRLVEQGRDVVFFVDSLSRLARAFNAAAPAGGRELRGGVDLAAVQKARRFFGAGRALDEGGSLTVVCTLLTGTGHEVDELLLQWPEQRLAYGRGVVIGQVRG